MPIGLVIHGGAGDVKADERAARLEAVRAAAQAAWTPLQQGRSALDAVELAVRSMESNPLLNAGYGGALNRDGVVELDAMIMDGRTAHIGAVAAVHRIEHPVALARHIMEHTPHHLLVGDGAERFAAEQGFALVDPVDLIAPRRRQLPTVAQDTSGDTVGAVALDSQGNVAVAVSTGGIDGKLPGRVGDSPIAGAGGYAENDLGAASATGVGEGIMRSLLTFRAVQALQDSGSAQAAAQQALDIFVRRFDGVGGLILIDRQGGIGIVHNTPFMPVAYVVGEQIVAQIAGQGMVGHP
jgi:beta-aspartyl-peptidase (threonine type)